MLVDVERVLVEVKAMLTQKPSWGAGEVLQAIARLEGEHRIAPDQFESFVRHFAHHLEDSFMGLVPTEDTDPPTDDGATSPAVVGTPHLQTNHKSEASWPNASQHPSTRTRPRPLATASTS